MHIEAQLDATHAQRLTDLQRRSNKSLSEVIADLIDANWHPADQALLPQDASVLFQMFDSSGLIGCMATDEQLSETYKQHLSFSTKNANHP